MPLKIRIIHKNDSYTDVEMTESEIISKLFGDDVGFPISVIKLIQHSENGEQIINLSRNNND